MTDNLRDRIAAVICNWYFGEDTAWEETAEPSRQEWPGCADEVIEQLKSTPPDDFTYGPDDEGYHVDVTWVAPGAIAKMLGQTD